MNQHSRRTTVTLSRPEYVSRAPAPRINITVPPTTTLTTNLSVNSRKGGFVAGHMAAYAADDVYGYITDDVMAMLPTMYMDTLLMMCMDMLLIMLYDVSCIMYHVFL